MTFAVMAILGHFSKSLLLFFIPQVFNFVYSLPQLFKVVPCPRHRMPDFDPTTNCLRPSTYAIEPKIEVPPEAQASQNTVSQGASSTGTLHRRKGPAVASNASKALAVSAPVVRDNMTLINLVLRLTGPLHERTTTNLLLLLQIICCVLGLLLRYYWSPQVYEATDMQPAAHATSGSTIAG